MSGIFYRIVAASALCAAITTSAYAQTTDTDHENVGAGSQIVCGTDLFNDGGERAALAKTALMKPELYKRMLADAKGRKERAAKLASGDEFPFFIRNRVTGMYDQITATLFYDGPKAKVWVDNADVSRIKKTTTDAIAKALETTTPSGSRNPAQGIIDNDTQVYGPVPPNANQDGVWFLLTDIKDGLSGGFVGGYFTPWDQTENDGSNQLNMLYIDSKEGIASGLPAVLSTLAHELQHLIHYNTNPQSEVFFNEGCSETASILNGYRDRTNGNYLDNTNIPLFRWSYNDEVGTNLLIDYSRAMTFVYYMWEQYGENFLSKFLTTRSAGMQRIDDALQTAGVAGSWQETMKGFAVANYVQKNYGNPQYVYKQAKPFPSNRYPTPAFTYGADFPASGSVTLQAYGISYVAYNNPGGLKIRFNAELPIAVMAILYRGTAVEEVRELQVGTDYVLGGSTAYDKVVFALASMQPVGQQNALTAVNWSAEKVILGVDDATAGRGALAMTSVVPQPAAGVATISFHSASSEPTWLELYDERGELVRNVIDGIRYDVGEHAVSISTDGLANGLYLARLRQGTSSATRTMIVMK